jgi:hypothetical protein
MKNLIRQKIFIGAFLTSYFLFFVITFSISRFPRTGGGGILLGHTLYGFPFAYYYSHCFGGYYLWFGLAGNILVAAIVCSVIGLISAHFWTSWLLPLWQTFSSPEFRAKWYI